jgi:hypothetical protein
MGDFESCAFKHPIVSSAPMHSSFILVILFQYHSNSNTRTCFSDHPDEFIFQSESWGYANLLYYQHYTMGLIPYCYRVVQIPDGKSMFVEFVKLVYDHDPWKIISK